mmetsp:Transcript_16910/g.34896  ORF Transcript_16910/g.34896 Transcript_16910/m.34896 type:complete len:80 (+) Transcript_16910:864-1103(+)
MISLTKSPFRAGFAAPLPGKDGIQNILRHSDAVDRGKLEGLNATLQSSSLEITGKSGIVGFDKAAAPDASMSLELTRKG